MLCASDEYLQLLRSSGHSLGEEAEWRAHCPTLPLAPLRFAIVGRMSSLHLIADGSELVRSVRALHTRVNMRKAQPPPPSRETAGHAPAHSRLGAVNLDQVALATQDAPWIAEMEAHVGASGSNHACRYLLFEDLLNQLAISRFHCVIKRDDAPWNGVHTAAFAATQCVYSIQDLGSLNGIHVNGRRVRHRNWTVLTEGMHVSFAGTSARARRTLFSHIDSDWRARAHCDRVFLTLMNASSPFASPEAQRAREVSARIEANATHVPREPNTESLTAQDMRVDLVFRHEMNAHAIDAWARMQHDPVAAAPDDSASDVQEPRSTEIATDSELAAVAARDSEPFPRLTLVRNHMEFGTANLQMDLYDRGPGSYSTRHSEVFRSVQRSDHVARASSVTLPAPPATPVAPEEPPAEPPMTRLDALDIIHRKRKRDEETPVTRVDEPTTMASQVLGEFGCAICVETMYEAVVLGCSHSYCRSCIQQWFKTKRACPVCRQAHRGALPSMRSVDKAIDLLVVSTWTDEQRAERMVRTNAIDRAALLNPPRAFDDEANDDDEDDEVDIPRIASQLTPHQWALLRAPPTHTHAIDVTTHRDSACIACCAVIAPASLRIRVTAIDTSGGLIHPTHYHLNCFVTHPHPLMLPLDTESLGGIDALSVEHRAILDALL